MDESSWRCVHGPKSRHHLFRLTSPSLNALEKNGTTQEMFENPVDGDLVVVGHVAQLWTHN